MGSQNWRIRKSSSGAVLPMVLIFSLMITLMTQTMLQTAWLQTKMVSSYQSTQLAFLEATAQLQTLENSVKDSFLTELPPNVQWRQFIPDTLHFGEQEGQNVYLVKSQISKEDGTKVKLSSTLGVRKYVSHAVMGVVRSSSELVIYHFDINGQIQNEHYWRPSVNTKLSNPVYFSFSQLFYVLSDQCILHIIDKWGNEINQIDLLENFNFEEKNSAWATMQWRKNLLSFSESIIDGEPKKLLAVILPFISEQMIIFDVTTANNNLPSKRWVLDFPNENKVQSAAFAQIKNNQSVLIVSLERLKDSAVLIYDLRSGVKQREWILPGTSTMNRLATEAIQITVVDSLEQGFANRVYLSDNQAQLWRIDVNEDYLKRVFYSPEYIKQFVGKPIVGRHSEGKGVIVYTVGISNNNAVKLYAIEDEQMQIFHKKPLFHIDRLEQYSQPLLRNGSLLCSTAKGIIEYDAATGEKLNEYINNQKISVNAPFYFGPLIAFQRRPLEKKLMVMKIEDDGLNFNEIETNSISLGRKAWHEL